VGLPVPLSDDSSRSCGSRGAGSPLTAGFVAPGPTAPRSTTGGTGPAGSFELALLGLVMTVYVALIVDSMFSAAARCVCSVGSVRRAKARSSLSLAVSAARSNKDKVFL
jgi:hypothetical protein